MYYNREHYLKYLRKGDYTTLRLYYSYNILAI